MKNHHEVGHFKTRLMIVLLSLFALVVTAGQSFAATTCSSCHGMPPLDSTDGTRQPATGAVVGNHQTHLAGGAQPAECAKCHANADYTSSHAATASYQIKMSANINSSPLGATYLKGTSFPQTNTPVLQTCSNVNCHFETITPVWGTSAASTNCGSCHANPPVSANHGKHLSSTAFGATITCSSCHPNYGTTSFSHATSAGKHKIVVNTLMNYAGGTSISWLPSQAKAYGQCSNVYCHSNGKSAYSNPTWNTSSTGCNFCHPSLSAKHSSHIITANLPTASYTSTANNSAGTIYDFGCANCHPNALTSHINGTVDITLNSTHGGPLKSKNNIAADGAGYTQNLGVSVTCAAAYCHSNGMATPTFYGNTFDWYEGAFSGDKCGRCHGNSPNTGGRVGSSAHSAHSVGIHYDNIYNGVSRKLPLAGGSSVNAAHGRNNRSTTINCNICHSITVTSFANDQNPTCSSCHKVGGSPAPLVGDLTIADASMHVNGTINVNFINQKIATKAQLSGSAFAGYTATTSGWSRQSNGMVFKTYTSSYDYTKSTLFAGAAAYSTVSGCATNACHAGITVKWTDSVTCTSCHTRLK